MKVLIRLGADVNEPNNTGSTPLHAASLNGYGPSMELLVEKGARIDAKNIYDYSPVNYADSNSRGHSPIYNHVNTVEYVLFALPSIASHYYRYYPLERHHF